jgi:phage gp36-like protein
MSVAASTPLYATREDLVQRFGSVEISQLEDLDNTGMPNEEISQAALMDASQEIDSYIAVRYAVPLPVIPALLQRTCCDIARYRLYKDRSTEEIKARYEKSIEWLVRLSTGKVLLTNAQAVNEAQALDLNTSRTAMAAVGSSQEVGVFSDAMMARMPGFNQ